MTSWFRTFHCKSSGETETVCECNCNFEDARICFCFVIEEQLQKYAEKHNQHLSCRSEALFPGQSQTSSNIADRAQSLVVISWPRTVYHMVYPGDHSHKSIEPMLGIPLCDFKQCRDFLTQSCPSFFLDHCSSRFWRNWWPGANTKYVWC